MTGRAVHLESERIQKQNLRLARDLAEVEFRRNATPQTLRKRQIAVIDELFSRDRITPDQFRAANEIHDVLSAVTRGLSIRISSFEPRIRGSYQEDWKPGLSRSYQERYIPWRDEAGKIPLLEKATVADLVLDIVISNFGITQTAVMWGCVLSGSSKYFENRYIDTAKLQAG